MGQWQKEPCLFHKRTLRSSSTSRRMQNGDNLQGVCLRSVNDQIGVDRKKFHRLIRQILAPMAPAWSSSKISDLVADDGFNPVGHLKTGVLLDVAPNLN